MTPPDNTKKQQSSGTGIRAIRKPILHWYDAHKRDLPWRHSRDPYAIWISEAMLQQTRVDTVIPYWERFLEQFPNVETLAEAELDDVYAVWTGLGYYSRARNLKHAAETVVRDHDGSLPDTVEGLQELKGIGRYTAGAVASIAFDREAPLVDGNVIRVFARLLNIREDSAAKHVVEKMWTVAEELVPGPKPGDLNQALMELGATVCTPRSPDCEGCPVRKHCAGHAAGDAESLPVKKKKAKQTKMRAAAAWIERGGKVLVVRRPETGLMAGLWELPSGALGPKDEAKDRLAEVIARSTGLELQAIESAGQVEHLFTHRRLTLEVFRARARPGSRLRLAKTAETKEDVAYVGHRWLEPEAVLELAHAGSTRKALKLLGIALETSARAAGRQKK